MVTPAYQPRDPSGTVLYQVIADHHETFLVTLAADPTATGLPAYVTEEFYASLQCGVLAHGFVRLACDTCPHQIRLAFSCKTRGFCPACAGRRMAQRAAHLKELTATIHTIIRRTIGQYYVHQAGRHGATRATVPPGSVTFVQRFGGSINLNVHVPLIVLEGIYEDRTAQGLTPRFRPQQPPTDAEIAAVLHKISQRVICQWRQRGSLEAGTKDVGPTGYDPARDEDPDRARPLAASVQQRMACGERAGQQVRRIGSGFGYEGESPTLSGPRCASGNGFSCTPTRRFQRTAATSWRDSSVIPPAARCRSSVWSKTRRVICSIRLRSPGPMAPPAAHAHPWNSWRSSQHSCRCHACL